MKKVLMIAYFFPPMGGPGVQRTSKFAKYLPAFGWMPIVLTANVNNPANLEQHDSTPLQELPACITIKRTLTFEPVQFYRSFASRWRLGRTVLLKETPGPVSKKHLIGSGLNFAKDLGRILFAIPDERSTWLPFALAEGLRIARNKQIDVIYSTSDPFTDHLVGYLLSSWLKKPWVADFRDPWTQSAIYGRPPRIKRKVDEYLEQLFLEKANKVVVTSDSTGDQFVAKYCRVPRQKIITITNGYDPDDFSSLQPVHNEEFTIAYVGRFDSPVTENTIFFQALNALLKNHVSLYDQIRAEFVGTFGRRSRRTIEKLGLDSVVNLFGYLPHREAIRHLTGADVLLMTMNSNPKFNPIILGKTFEYLAAKKPILALVPEGETARLVRDTKNGIVVSPDDVEGIKEAIYQLYRQYEDGSLGLEENRPIDKFARENLTGKLAALFSELV